MATTTDAALNAMSSEPVCDFMIGWLEETLANQDLPEATRTNRTAMLAQLRSKRARIKQLERENQRQRELLDRIADRAEGVELSEAEENHQELIRDEYALPISEIPSDAWLTVDEYLNARALQEVEDTEAVSDRLGGHC